VVLMVWRDGANSAVVLVDKKVWGPRANAQPTKVKRRQRRNTGDEYDQGEFRPETAFG
jgi:hypothetical protein